MGGIFLHVLPDVQNVAAPPGRQLEIRQPWLHGEVAGKTSVGVDGLHHRQLLRRQHQTRQKGPVELAPRLLPMGDGADPVGDRAVHKDHRRIGKELVEVVQHSDLREGRVVTPADPVNLGEDVLPKAAYALKFSTGKISPDQPAVIGRQPDAAEIFVEGRRSALGESDCRLVASKGQWV